MSSQLATIYSTLAAQAVTVGTVSVSALAGATLVDSVESAQLPVRLLLPVGGSAAGTITPGRTFKAGSTQGGVLTIDWTITDLLLWRAAGAGIGLADSAGDLIAYCAAYLDVIGALRTNRWAVTSVTFPTIGGLEWPAQSERWFLGVQARLSIREIV